MICPHCHSESCRRSRRKSWTDIFLSFLRLRPWRCRACEKRFYGWKVPVPFAQFAHCPRCGNFDLQQISRDRVDEAHFLWLKRLLGISAYRCDPCRERFFSVLKLHRIVPIVYEGITSHSSGH